MILFLGQRISESEGRIKSGYNLNITSPPLVAWPSDWTAMEHVLDIVYSPL